MVFTALLSVLFSALVGLSATRADVADASPLGVSPALMGTSSLADGSLTATVTASKTTLPAGGGSVTFTYRLANTSSNYYFYSAPAHVITKTSVCTTLKESTASTWRSGDYTNYMEPGDFVEWTCTTTVTASVTETFNIGMWRYDPYGQVSFAASQAVQVSTATATPTPTATPTATPTSAPSPLPTTAAVSGAPVSGTTSSGILQATVTANPGSLPIGGGPVTYTYTTKNTSTTATLFYSFVDSATCSPLYQTTDSTLHTDGYGTYWLLPGETAKYTCSTTVTDDTKETFTAEFYRYVYNSNTGSYDPQYLTATPSVTVDVQEPPVSCSTLWYSSGGTASTWGTIGLLQPTSPYELRPLYTIKDADLSNAGTQYKMDGSAGLAVDPTNPSRVYYIARNSGDYNPAVFGGLWVYDYTTKTSTRITTSANTPDAVRMGAAPNGDVFAIGSDGALWTLKKGTTTWTRISVITLGTSSTVTAAATFVPGKTISLNSGDLAFDGLGNLWVIGSRQSDGIAFLYVISWADITDGGTVTGKPIGSMGKGEFNGIAFTADGNLYATTRSLGSTTPGALWQVDMITGRATRLKNLSEQTEDIGSCALPKPELSVKKEAFVSPDATVDQATGVIENGTITYRVTIENLGNLAASGVTFLDKDYTAGNTWKYVKGTAKLNPYSATPQTIAEGVNSKGEPVPTFHNSPMLVKSPGSKYPGVVDGHDSAVIEFQVTTVPGQTKICNSALVNFIGGPAGGIISKDPHLPGADDPTCVNILKPVIGVDKKGYEPGTDTVKTTVTADANEVKYTYDVSVDPNQPKGMATTRVNGVLVEGPKPFPSLPTGTESLKNVTVTDDKCSPVKPVYDVDSATGTTTTVNVGDRDNNNQLDPGEIWKYTCTTTPSLTTATTNTVQVSGVGFKSTTTVTDKDTWTVEPTVFQVQKDAKTETGWAPNGTVVKVNPDGTATVSYQVKVTNSGTIPGTAPVMNDKFTPPAGFEVTAIAVDGSAVPEKATGENVIAIEPKTGTDGKPVVLQPAQSETHTVTVTLKIADANGDGESDWAGVDWAKVGVCEAATGTGNASLGVYNKVDYANDKDGTENNDACVPLESPKFQFEVLKQTPHCDTNVAVCDLGGAEFALYSADPYVKDATGNYPQPIDAGIAVNDDKPESDVLGNTIYPWYKSGELFPGTYWLVETKAPDGFSILPTPIEFRVGAGGITLVDSQEIVELDRTNTSVAFVDFMKVMNFADEEIAQLPEAGGDGSPRVFLLGGLLLLLIGGAGYIKQTSGWGPERVRIRK